MSEATCRLCIKVLPLVRGNRRLFCSDVCRYDFRRMRDQGYKNPEMVVELRKIKFCQICGAQETAATRRGKPDKRLLSLDHNHKTGFLRGILCSNCNRGMGLLKDDVEILKKTIAYLERST